MYGDDPIVSRLRLKGARTPWRQLKIQSFQGSLWNNYKNKRKLLVFTVCTRLRTHVWNLGARITLDKH
jgi:hypothetical protein